MIPSMFRNRSGAAAQGGDVRLALETAGIPSFWRTLHQSQAELRRCARYEHPLSLVVLGLSPDSLRRIANGQGADPRLSEGARQRFECTALLMLGWMVRDGTRESDLITYVAQHHAYAVILPETDGAGAYAALRRVSEAFQWRASLQVQMGYSVFPQDGLTIEDLYKLSRRLWKVRPDGPRLVDGQPETNGRRDLNGQRDGRAHLNGSPAQQHGAKALQAEPAAAGPDPLVSSLDPETDAETRLESNG
jgi:hypothetical protein